jgi:PAS domain S-box-containing protein
MGAEMNYIYRAYSAGAVDYLTKPIDPDVVRAKVAVFVNLFKKDRRILRQAEALREAEKRQREMELAELRRSNEKRYRNLADAVPLIVWTARPDGSVQYANRAWHLFTGIQREQTRGWGWLAAVHTDDRERIRGGWTEAVAREATFTMECRLRGTDSGFRAHIVHAIPERDSDGDLVGWLGTMSDCEDLRQAIHARDQFLETASHELRTPISTLDLVLLSVRKLLGQASPSDVTDKLAGKVDTAARQTRRLERLVSTLLDVTRISGGRPLLERTNCDVVRVVREAVERLREEAQRAGCALQLATGEGPANGSFDPLRIDQVVTNLVSNAIRYGAGQPIEVAVERTPSRVRIQVKDHGCGIAPEHLGMLFGRFQRIATGSHQTGLGLGLYISRHIARAHGGDILARSEVGKGSEFVVELPCGDGVAAREAEHRA